MKPKNRVVLFVILALMTAVPAFAHKVILFAWVEDGMIYTESSFASKRKAKNCPIIVKDDTGRIVHEGKTDEQGNYSFKIPDPIETGLVLTLKAGIGHQAEWKISKDELVLVPSKNNIHNAMQEKEKLEAGPSPLKIISGIAIIFLAALMGKFLFQSKKGLK